METQKRNHRLWKRKEVSEELNSVETIITHRKMNFDEYVSEELNSVETRQGGVG